MKTNDRSFNEECNDDLNIQFKKLQKYVNEKMALLQGEIDKLRKEKDNAQSVVSSTKVSNNDIIEINAAGKIISVLRSTLTQAPDSMFSNMFSGRWEDSVTRDDSGRVFLDYDPELIEIIVDYLRIKKIEGPNDPLGYPDVPAKKSKNFLRLLRYFGLDSYFYPPYLLDIQNIDIVQESTNVDVVKTDNKVTLSYNEKKGDYFVGCTPSLDVDNNEGSFWKVTIDALPNNHWVYLGVIGNLNPRYNSYGDSTSYGWTTSYGWSKSGCYYKRGICIIGDMGWTGFVAGECLHFHFVSNKLTMYSVQKDKSFVIENIDQGVEEYYIHFNFSMVMEPN